MSTSTPGCLDARPPAGVTGPDDRLLVERARRGDLPAFEALYRRHAGRVHSLCLRLAADESRAAEATQEVFVKAWKALPRFEGRSAFSTWLHRLAVNVSLDARRAAARRAEVDLPPEDGPLGEELHVVATARATEAGYDLARAIAALPEVDRVVFVLHDVEGYRHREIAEMTGSPEGTCRARLHQARRRLRERLAAWR